MTRHYATDIKQSNVRLTLSSDGGGEETCNMARIYREHQYARCTTSDEQQPVYTKVSMPCSQCASGLWRASREILTCSAIMQRLSFCLSVCSSPTEAPYSSSDLVQLGSIYVRNRIVQLLDHRIIRYVRFFCKTGLCCFKTNPMH